MGWMLAAMLAAQMGGDGMVTVAHDLMSGIDRPQQVVVQNDTEWARIWRAHAGDALPPLVDFSTRTVLAVFLGTRTSGGFEAEITGVRQEGSATVVEWVEHRPAPGHVAAMIITSPAHIVSVPRIQGDVRFVQAGPAAPGR
jgi:hypothetical protein